MSARVCECFPRLREVTAARELRYLADPSKAAPEGPQSNVLGEPGHVGLRDPVAVDSSLSTQEAEA